MIPPPARHGLTPGAVLRLVWATLVTSLWCAMVWMLLVAASRATRPGATEAALGWFQLGVLTVALTLLLPRLWRWAITRRPPVVQDDGPSRPHLTLGGTDDEDGLPGTDPRL